MKILITNDDGYRSAGLKALYDALRSAHEVVVVAPATEQSGVGHAFTYQKPLRYTPLEKSFGMDGFRVEGTPADCVKFGIGHLCSVRPDIVVSGINAGENSGISGYYSGTVAAARESAFWGVPGFAVSVCGSPAPHFAEVAVRSGALIQKIVETCGRSIRKLYVNINFPSGPSSSWKGPRITRQSMAWFDDRYERVESENGTCEFYVSGDKKDLETSDRYDSPALIGGFITITPLNFDATAESMLEPLAVIEQ